MSGNLPIGEYTNMPGMLRLRLARPTHDDDEMNEWISSSETYVYV